MALNGVTGCEYILKNMWKWLWLSLENYPYMYLEGLRKAMKTP